MRRSVRMGCIVSAIPLVCGARLATASFLGYAIFGSSSVQTDGTVTGGMVASNGNITTNGGSYSGIIGGGNYNDSNNSAVTGSITVAGGVTSKSLSSWNGPIVSGANVALAGSSVGTVMATGSVSLIGSAQGNITAGMDFSVASSGYLRGNASANRNISIGGLGEVQGNVTYGNSFVLSQLGYLTGSKTQAATPVPTPPVFFATMPADPFPAVIPSGPNVSSGTSAAAPLAPGMYGALNVTGLNTLYLTAGTYYFNTATFPAYVELLNISAATPINIFIASNTVLNNSNFYVNGQDLSNTTSPLASDVLIDTHGNFTFNGFDDLTGTVFTHDGNITSTGVSYVDGSVLAGGSVSATDRLNVNYVPSSIAVPEPSSWAAFLGTGLLVLWRWFERRLRPARTVLASKANWASQTPQG